MGSSREIQAILAERQQKLCAGRQPRGGRGRWPAHLPEMRARPGSGGQDPQSGQPSNSLHLVPIVRPPCSASARQPIRLPGTSMATLPRERWSVASIREVSGVSLEEIARNTKLRVTFLKAIEDANFELLPGGIYNISYIRQYARAIGADETSLVRLYQALCQDENQA